MSEKATPSKPTVACPAPLVLFGIDSRGKPKAAGSESSMPASP
jgi:hypothetical protein